MKLCTITNTMGSLEFLLPDIDFEPVVFHLRDVLLGDEQVFFYRGKESVMIHRNVLLNSVIGIIEEPEPSILMVIEDDHDQD